MRQTKLIETLRTLGTRERSRWRQYVHSDFFNKHRQLRRLCDYILARAPDFPEAALEKERVSAWIYGADTIYNELKINNLISDLYELLLGFLSYTRQENDPLESRYQGVMALLERNLDKQAAAALEKYRMLLDRRADRSADWYRYEMRYWEAGETLSARQSRRAAGEHLFRQTEALRNAHLLEKLRLEVALLSRKTLAVVGTAAARDLNDNWPGDPHTVSLPAAHTYLAAQDLVRRPSPEAFSLLTTALDTHYPVFQREELSALYQCALNYCIRRINDGQPGAYADALFLYRTLLDRGVLLHNGRLSQWTYKNIATAGLRSGDFDWTEQFLHRYREALPQPERDNAFAFNLASLYFEKRDFSRALRTLQDVEFTDISYHVGAKILQMKSFYLLGETEALHSLLDAAEQMLRRDKRLAAFGKTTNLNFLRCLRQISQWKQKAPARSREKNEAERLELIGKVKNLQPLANKDWLLKILD